MPNGGSDCCGTCWYNAANEGLPGYAHLDVAEHPAHYCVIRGFAPEDPFYTYCANHPHRIPQGDRIPIGPVFGGDSFGSRWVLHPSPDGADIRAHLAHLLEMAEANDLIEGFYVGDEPIPYYPGWPVADVVREQCGEFGIASESDAEDYIRQQLMERPGGAERIRQSDEVRSFLEAQLRDIDSDSVEEDLST